MTPSGIRRILRRSMRGGGEVMSTKHDLVIVANRLPVRRIQRQGRRDWKLSPGGLVSALIPILEGRNGVWVGWGGHTGPAVGAFRYGDFGIPDFCKLKCFV